MAVLGLDRKPFEQGLSDARGEAERGGSGIGRALGSAAKAGAAALAAAAGAVTAFAGSSVSAGMEFDSAMSQVAATMGKTVDDLENEVGTADTAFGAFEGNLREFAQFLGANTAFSATQAAEALNYMALAGYDAQQSMDMLPSVLSLAAAGNFDLARASDMVTDAQTAFGISAERTSQMVDEMAKAASTGNTSVEQLGDAFLIVGGLAQELNGGMVELDDGTELAVDGLQELEIALTAMANAGVKGSEAGTHMRNMLLKLSSPTDKGIEAFTKLGVSVFDAEGNMRSLEAIFGDLSASLGELTQEEKIQAISDIFNTRDIASAEALLNAVEQDWDRIGASILDAQGAAAQMADTQLDNLAGDITLFKSALEGAKIAISDSLTPTLREFVQFGTDAVSTLGTAFREEGLAGALEALGPIVEQGIALIMSKLPAILTAAVSLLEALVNGIITNLPMLIPAVVQMIQQIVNSIVENLPMLLDAAVEILFALADGLIEMLPELIPAIVEIILTIVEKLTEPDTLMKLIDASYQIVGAIAQGLIKAIPKLIEAAPKIMMNLIEAILRYIPQLISSGTKLMGELAQGIAQGASAVVSAVTNLMNSVGETIKRLVKEAVSWGRDLIQNFINGIKQKWESLKATVKNLASTVKSYIGFSVPEKGPLSDADTYMPDMMKLFAKGIKDNTGLVTDQISRSFDFDRSLLTGAAAQKGQGAAALPVINLTALVELDGEVLSRKQYSYNLQETNRHGMSFVHA